MVELENVKMKAVQEDEITKIPQKGWYPGREVK
jgi:hypothetical protein